MLDGLQLSIDPQSLGREEDRIIRRYLTAGTQAVSEATKHLKKRLSEETEAAGGGQLRKAWGSRSYPLRGPAREPAGEVYIRGNDRTRGTLEYFSEPGTIRGRRGQWLAIPLPAAGSKGRGRDLTPAEWESRTGVKLRLVPRKGKASLLVADNGVLSGRAGAFRPRTKRRTSADERRGFIRGQTTVPIFALVPMVQHRNSLAIDPIVRSAEADLIATFYRRLGVEA